MTPEQQRWRERFDGSAVSQYNSGVYKVLHQALNDELISNYDNVDRDLWRITARGSDYAYTYDRREVMAFIAGMRAHQRSGQRKAVASAIDTINSAGSMESTGRGSGMMT